MGFGDVGRTSEKRGFGGVGKKDYAGQLQNRIANYETRFNAVGVTPPEPEKKSNLLLKALDIIDRPRNAIVNTLAGGSFTGGLTGKEHTNVSDLLTGIDNKYAKGAAGFVGDVLLDPLTYLSLGAAGAGKTALKVAGKQIADVTPLAKGIGAAVQKTGIPEALGPVFSNKYIRRGVTSAAEMPDVEKARDIIRYLPQKIRGEQQISLDEMKGIWKGATPEAAQEAAGIVEAPIAARKVKEVIDITPEPPLIAGRQLSAPGYKVPLEKDLKLRAPENKILAPYEKPPIEKAAKSTPEISMLDATRQLGMKTTPEGRTAALVAERLAKQTAAKDVQAGVEFGELPNYLRHLYDDPPERVQAVLNRWQKERVRLSPKAGYQKERSIPTMAEAEKLGLHPVKDVRVLTTVRELEGVRQRAIEGMYNGMKELGDNIAIDAIKAPAGWKVLPAKQLQGLAVHPEVARFLERFNQTMQTETGTATFFNGLNKVQNVWKGLVTTSVPFHLRNAIGNFFNNFLAGVVNPKVYEMAAQIKTGSKEAYVLAGKNYTGDELLRMFRGQGLEGFGIFRGENMTGIVKMAKEAFDTKKSLSPMKASRRAGDAIETNAKLAHFIDRMAKGDTAEQAAESVRKFLFDYSDLTLTEEKIRAFVPFMTWTRKNIPLQLENLIKQPGKMTAINKLTQNMQASLQVGEGDAPDWMRQELAIPIMVNKDGSQTYLMPDLPVTNLGIFGGGETMKNLVGMLSPLAKVPIELGMGRQIFSGAPIEKYPGARARYGNLELPAKVAYGLSQLGGIPRTAADIAGGLNLQQPAQSGDIPMDPRKNPAASVLLGSLTRSVNPKRQEIFRLMDRDTQLANYRKYLEEAKGKTVPTLAELKGGKKGFGKV